MIRASDVIREKEKPEKRKIKGFGCGNCIQKRKVIRPVVCKRKLEEEK